MIPLFKVRMSPEAIVAATRVLSSGWVGQGPESAKFEAAVGELVGCPHPVAVNSGTSALHLAYHMLPKGEILTTPLTCTATNWPALACGHRLRWVDVDPKTLTLDLDDLRRKISASTSAIVAVHWGGTPDDLSGIQEIADSHGIPIIEDAAHALGAELDGQPVGSSGNFVVFSFQAIKHVTAVDGGVLCCPNAETAARAKLLRWYGIDRDHPSEDLRCETDITEWGYKFHLNDLSAAVGLANLKGLPEVLVQHRAIAEQYTERLAGVPGIEIPQGHGRSAWWMFTILAEGRDALRRKLLEGGVMSSRVHARNDTHSCVRDFRTPLPQLDEIEKKLLCLPVGWWVNSRDVDTICNLICEGW